MILIISDGATVMSKLSALWSDLQPEEQQSWNSKASEGTHWSEQPKKSIVRDMTSSMEDNVR